MFKVKMGIDVETWRARIGLYHAASVGRYFKKQQKAARSTGARTRSQPGGGVDLNCFLHFFVTCLLALMYTDLHLVSPYLSSSMKFMSVKGFDQEVLRFVDIGLKSCHRIVSRVLAISKSTLVALSLLLIISGDVELNPGPLQAEGDSDLNLANLMTELEPVNAKWYAIGIQLRVDPAKLQEFKTNNQNTNSSQCLSDTLIYWLNQNVIETPVTWQEIVRVLRSPAVSENRVATEIEKKYCQIPQDTESDSESQDRHADENAMMIDKFDDLCSSFCTSLCRRNFTVKDFLTQPPFRIGDNFLWKEHEKELISSTKSLKDVFNVLKQYISFFNYDLIVDLIEIIGSEEDNRKLQAYMADFTQYSSRSVTKCPPKLNWERFRAGRSTGLTVQLGSMCSDYTAKEIKHFRVHLRDALASHGHQKLIIPTYALVFDEWHIDHDGCIEVVFQVPSFLHHTLKCIQPQSAESDSESLDRTLQQLCVDLYSVTSCHRKSFRRQQSKHAILESGIDFAEDLRMPNEPKLVSGHIQSAGEKRSLDQRLRDACYNNDLEDVEHLVKKQKVDVFQENEKGFTPLHLACESGNIEIVKFLVEKMLLKRAKRDIMKYTGDGRTPLHLASVFGHLDVVKYLTLEPKLKCDATIGSKDNDIKPLSFAARGGHLDIVKYLIEELNCDPTVKTKCNNTPLHHAAQFGHLDVVRYLIETHNSDPLAKGQQNCLPLHLACESGHLKVVKYLLNEDLLSKHQVTIEHILTEERKSDGCVAVHLACDYGHLDVVKFLLSLCECNPDDITTPVFKMTPLHFATRSGHLNIVEYLVKDQQCSPTTKTSIKRNTALHMAAKEGKLKVVKFFVESCHCAVNVMGYLGHTPCEWALKNNHKPVVEYLYNVNLRLNN